MCTYRFDWSAVKTVGGFCKVDDDGHIDIGFERLGGVQENGNTKVVFASFATGAHSYACTPNNLIKGARKRLLGVRQNDVALHRLLVLNQANAVRRRGCKLFKSHFARELRKIRDWHDAMPEWVEQPHPKRGLRRKVRQKYHSRGMKAKDTRRYTDYKSKPDELLPKGKQLRAIGEISESSAFEYGPLAAEHKHCYAVPFHYLGGVSTFIEGPTDGELDRAWDLLVNSDLRVRHVYFSDDSCIAIKCSDGTLTVNVDFSWSDGSMFYPAFNYAKEVWAQESLCKEEIRSSFKQCRKPIRLINRVEGFHPKTKKAKSFIEIPVMRGHYILPSGFGGTTSMNNNSEVLFFVCLMEILPPSCTREEAKQYIIQAAWCAGLQVKLDVAEDLEDIQFLKHSWGRDETGVYRPYVNLACWLRGYGIIDGHASGNKRMSFNERMHVYVSDIVASRVNWGRTALSEVFARVYNRPSNGLNKHLLVDELKRTGISGYHISEQSILKRYKIDSAAYHHFLSLCEGMGVGVHISHPVVCAIMNKDYGYCSDLAVPAQASLPRFTLVDGKLRQDLSDVNPASASEGKRK